MMKNLLLISSLLFSLSTFSKTELAANVEVQYGKSWGSGQIYGKLKDGYSYRFKIFGGAKMPKIKWLNAVGLGLELTYSKFRDKFGTPNFKYERYTWDWMHIPFGIGFLKFNPGLSWVVTSIRDNALGIQEKSIRPAFIGDVSLPIRLFKHLSFMVTARGEYVWEDTERTSDGRKVNITGSFFTGYAGFRYDL